MSTITKMLPLMNRILVKKADPVTHSKKGVLLPESRKNQVLQGTVVAVGPGTTNEKGACIPCCLNVGDVVVLPEWGGTKVQQDKDEYYLYRENDILAKLN